MGRGGKAIGTWPVGLVTQVKDEKHVAFQYAPIPLTEVHINANVVNFIAEVEVVQTYVNREKNPIEAIYIFPVEEEAAVVHFYAKLDGREVKTVVKEKEEARAEYQEAISNRQTAFLLEETKPDIFQVKVGHLASKSTCEVKITYLMELPVEEEKTRLTIPTTIAPKYVPSNDDSAVSQHISKIGYDSTTPAGMTMHVTAQMKTKIKGISSPSQHGIANSIEKKKDQGYFKSSTTLKGDTADMDKDIVLLFDTEQPNLPKLDLEKGEDGSVVAMLSLVPEFDLDDVKSEIIFLIDCSGSMRGRSINLAKEALQLLLNSLPMECHFNIFKFGSRYEALFPESKKYDDTTLEDAKRYAINMDSDFGGTEVLSPLNAIFNQKGINGIPKQVFVLTDGAVSNSDSCIKCVKNNSSTARVFTMGIGDGADRHLVKGMARAGRGTHVFATYGEEIAPKVLTQLKHSLQPCISNVKVDWGDGASRQEEEKPVEMPATKSLIGHRKTTKEVDDAELKKETQAPIIIPPIYSGNRLLLYKMYATGKEPKCVKITAQTCDGPLDVTIDYEEQVIFEGKDIHCMFARKLIQDLEEGNYDTAGEEDTKDLITELGLKYGLASRHTSFIGVDTVKGKDVEKKKDSVVMETRQIRNQINQGYGGFDSCNEKAPCYAAPSAPSASYITNNLGGSRSRPRGSSATNEKCPSGGEERGMVKGFVKEKKRFSFRMPKFKINLPKLGKSTSSTARIEKCRIGGAAFDDSDDDDNEKCPVGAPRSAPAPRSAAPPGSQEPVISKAANSNTQKLLKLTSLQVANGSFRKEEAVVEISGKSMAQIDGAAEKESIDKDVWFTAVVVALIENMFADDKDYWDMIVGKARKWMKKSGVNDEDVVKKAKIFIQ